MKQKFILLFLLAGILYTTAKANESEPNNTWNKANTLALNGSNSGIINPAGDVDWWKVKTNGDGQLSITLTPHSGNYTYVELYDTLGTIELAGTYSSSAFSISADGLAQGTYYLKVYCYYSTDTSSYTISNTFTQPAQPNDAEPDSTRSTALVLPLNNTVTGHIGYYYKNHRDTVDEYKVTTNADGALNLHLVISNSTYVYFNLYDNDGTILLHQDYTSGDDNYTVDGLAKGTYYIKIFCYYNYQFAPYTLSNTFTAATPANDPEPDSTKATALTLPLNGSVTGHIGYYYQNHRDTTDEYKLTIPVDGDINLTLTIPNSTYVYFNLYDNDGTTLLHQDYTSGSDVYNVDGLAAGTYYIKVFCYYNYQFAPYTLKDTLYTYNQNDIEPNKYASQAMTLPANDTATGHVGFYYKLLQDTVDWYKINYTGSGALSVNLSVKAHVTGGSDYTYFQIYKDTAAAPLFSDYTSGTETANLTGLSEGYYYVKIFEYYNYQFTAYSITPTFTQVDIAKLRIISKDTLANCSDSSTLVVKPTASKPPYTLQLYRFGIAYGNPVVVASSKNVIFGSLPEGSYSVKAYGDGATGTAFGKTPNLGFEPAPTGLFTTNITSTSAKLNWDSLACVKYFVVEYKIHDSATWLLKNPAGNVKSYVLRGLTAGKTYDWRVASDDSANHIIAQSAYADSISFTTASSFIASGGDGQENLSINSNKNGLTVAPNPANNYFIIHYSNTVQPKLAATLYDVNGRPVWSSGLITSESLNGKQVNVNQFAKGIFYLKIINENGQPVATAKVMISE